MDHWQIRLPSYALSPTLTPNDMTRPIVIHSGSHLPSQGDLTITSPSDAGSALVQDLVPPLLALVAASAEVNAARTAPVGSLGLMSSRHSLASLAGLRSAGQGAVRALGWAAGVLHSTTLPSE